VQPTLTVYINLFCILVLIFFSLLERVPIALYSYCYCRLVVVVVVVYRRTIQTILPYLRIGLTNSSKLDNSQASMFSHIAICVLYYFTLVAIYSTSYEVSMFRAVKSENGEVLCATSPPNKTVNAVESRTKCLTLCSRGCPSPCQAINYRKNSYNTGMLKFREEAGLETRFWSWSCSRFGLGLSLGLET